MSYFPQRKRAQKIAKLLEKDPPKDRWWQPPTTRKQVLRESLLAVTCPVVCVGKMNDTGWHELCETRVDNAMRELGL